MPRPFAAAVVAAGLCSATCGREPAEAPACPSHLSDSPARARQVLARLEATPEGARLLERAEGRAMRLCFGQVAPSMVSTAGVLHLDARLATDEMAARVGHLVLHLVEGAPFDEEEDDARTCDARVATALERESRAYAVELRLRRALRVREPIVRYEFEEAFWRTPAARRELLVLRYLREHPHGAPGLDALGEQYAERCSRLRARGR